MTIGLLLARKGKYEKKFAAGFAAGRSQTMVRTSDQAGPEDTKSQ